MAPEWHKKRPLYNVSCKCLLLAKPVLQPDPYLQGSLVFQFLGYRGKYRKMGKDVNCQSTIFNTNHSFLNTFCEAAILPIFHSLFKFNSIFLICWNNPSVVSSLTPVTTLHCRMQTLTTFFLSFWVSTSLVAEELNEVPLCRTWDLFSYTAT